MADEQWEKRAKRIFKPPFDPWQVLDAFQGWFEVQMRRKGLDTAVRADSLHLTDGRITPKSRADAVARIREDNLTPSGYWETHSAFKVIEAVERGTEARIRCALWWDFSDNELLVITNGPDRDEALGFGARVQEWLDAATPHTKKPERVAHYTIKSPESVATPPARVEKQKIPLWAKWVGGVATGLLVTVLGGAILAALGLV